MSEFVVSKKQIFEQALGSYTCDDIPDDWDSLDEDAKVAWLDDNKWQFVEDWDTEFLWTTINNAAFHLAEFIMKHGGTIVE